MNTILASVALLATAVAGQGSAIVINSCSYPVSLTNVPASGGGYSQIGPNTLQSGGQYSQVYTQLSNGDGWSIKLSPSSSTSGGIMQFEYTYQNDGTIWYDLSDVNGNPWNGDWEITGTGGCQPRQAAYMYSTDDAYGEQSCEDSSSVTVTLCSGSSGGSSGGVPSIPGSLPSVPGASALSGISAPSEGAPAAPSTTSPPASPPEQQAAAADPSAQQLGSPAGGNTVTNVVTEIVTMYVTPSPQANKRHARHLAHHRRH